LQACPPRISRRSMQRWTLATVQASSDPGQSDGCPDGRRWDDACRSGSLGTDVLSVTVRRAGRSAIRLRPQPGIDRSRSSCARNGWTDRIFGYGSSGAGSPGLLRSMGLQVSGFGLSQTTDRLDGCLQLCPMRDWSEYGCLLRLCSAVSSAMVDDLEWSQSVNTAWLRDNRHRLAGLDKQWTALRRNLGTTGNTGTGPTHVDVPGGRWSDLPAVLPRRRTASLTEEVVLR
jgi:hypothetical protein